MIIDVARFEFTDLSTIGEMLFDSVFQCYTLEDKVRPIGEKVYAETCIPLGSYKIKLRKEGTIYQDYKKRFPEFFKGSIYVTDIEGFEYVLIHIGNKPEDSAGCILVGEAFIKNKLVNSATAFKKIYPAILKALENKEDVTINIMNKD